MWLICAFLRMVWGGGKGEGYSPSVRASTQPDTTVGTERFRTLYLQNFSRSKSCLCPFYIGAILWFRRCLFALSDGQLTCFKIQRSGRIFALDPQLSYLFFFIQHFFQFIILHLLIVLKNLIQLFTLLLVSEQFSWIFKKGTRIWNTDILYLPTVFVICVYTCIIYIV